jgi:glycosyltransferase involved in cell wall biosynthesis
MAAPATTLPGISVIIPAYNYAHYLPHAIASVLAQGYPHFELIIVDDGSTDHTAAVVARYPAPVRYLHQTNAGLPAARNTGIRAAQFPLLCFLDADDALAPGLLFKAIDSLHALPDSFAIVAFRTQLMDQDAKLMPTKTRAGTRGEEILGRDIIHKTRYGTTGLLARREVFEQAGYFDETLRSSEDRDMWIRIASHRRIFLHGERLAHIRRHSASMSRNTARMKANMARVIRKAHRDERVPRREIFYWLRVCSFLHFQGAWMYWDERRRLPALRDLAVSLLLWPWFPNHDRLNEPLLFRVRAALTFLRPRR